MPLLTQFLEAPLQSNSHQTILFYKGYNSILGIHGADNHLLLEKVQNLGECS